MSSGGYQRFEYRQETEAAEGQEAEAAAVGQQQQSAASAAGVEDIRARLERIKQSVAF